MKKTAAIAAAASTIAAALFLLTASGCKYLTERKVGQAVAARQKALAAADAASYLDTFSPEYQDNWLDLDQARAKAASRFKEKPVPIIGFAGHEIVVKGDKAVVSERFTLEDRVNGRPRRYDEIEHLVMERRGERWLVVRGDEILRLLARRMEEESRIDETLLRREAALVNEDLDSYMSLVSSRYRHRDEGPAEVRAKVSRNFLLYDDLKFRSFDRKIWFFGDSATVEQQFTLEAFQVGQPKKFESRERFELERTKDGWKFIKGL